MLRIYSPQSSGEAGGGNSDSIITWSQKRRTSPGLCTEDAMYPLGLGAGYSELKFTNKYKDKRL